MKEITTVDSPDADRDRDYSLWFLAGTILIVLSVLTCRILWGYSSFAADLSHSAPLNRRTFESGLWKVPVQVEHSRTSRSEMVDDLLSKISFVGWTKREVEELLGPAESPPYDRNEEFAYFLGKDRSFFPIDNEWLGFDLGNTGKVIRAYTFIE